MIIKIKPLSVNKVWQGRRFKTKEYDVYEKELFYQLPQIEIPKGKLKVHLIFGLSSKGGDIDNPTKPFLDVLQKKYKFNDNLIYLLTLGKVDVKKGGEFIEFNIEPF